MTQEELLDKVMVGLDKIPPHLRDTIRIHMDDILLDMIDSGVPTTLIDLEKDFIDRKCLGAVVRGVADVWNHGNSDTKVSEYYRQRVDKLRGKSHG